MIIMEDEILVKGTDGKWYILRGEDLTPYEAGASVSRVDEKKAEELPKGVSEAVYQKMEHHQVEPIKSAQEISTPQRPPSVLSVPVSKSAPVSNLAVELEKLVAETVKASGVVFSDENLTKRFKIFVSARLRDVRDGLETQQIMMRNVKVGGLGMKEEDVKRAQKVIEEKFQEFNKKWREAEARKMEEFKKKQAEDRVGQERERTKQQQDELEKKHHMLLAKAGVVEKFKVESSKLKVVEDNKPSLTMVEKTKKAAVPVSKPIQKPKIQTKEEKPVIVKKVATAATKSPSLQSSSAIGEGKAMIRPKVVDVKYTPRLLGPIEELKEMRLIDFRRLARDSADAIMKIRAKIDLLGEESFTKKLDGINAWKQSEPARLYFALSAEAIASLKSVESVIADHEAKKELTLTPVEFHAIMELNKSLRY